MMESQPNKLEKYWMNSTENRRKTLGQTRKGERVWSGNTNITGKKNPPVILDQEFGPSVVKW